MSPETWATADRAVRELAPAALDAIRCGDEAARLRALDQIRDSLTAGEAVSAAMAILRRLRPLAFGCRHAVAVGDWALAVAYAAERGREGLGGTPRGFARATCHVDSGPPKGGVTCARMRLSSM